MPAVRLGAKKGGFIGSGLAPVGDGAGLIVSTAGFPLSLMHSLRLSERCLE